MRPGEAYSALDRLLHRLALGNAAVAELSFEFEQALVRPDPQTADAAGAPVFIAGLARAGTTALLRRLHATGQFRSLTYRQMPFVLAPTLWSRIARRSPRVLAKAERAHGDGILVDADSPEGLEEVFWRVLAGPAYLRADALLPHAPDADTRAAFRCYVAALLHMPPQPATGLRYLSKNNNNSLRLATLRQVFPEAVLLVPVRAPLEQAASLWRQHRRFTEPGAMAPFVSDYMRWLAHHEFGPDHRPFRLPLPSAVPAGADPSQRDYWLGLWVDLYGWLAETAPAGTRFVCYEDLCTDPPTWQRLAERVGVAPQAGAEQADFRLPRTASRFAAVADAEPMVDAASAASNALAERALALYERLRLRAHAAMTDPDMEA